MLHLLHSYADDQQPLQAHAFGAGSVRVPAVAVEVVAVVVPEAAEEAVVLEDLRLMEHLLIYLHVVDQNMVQTVDLE